MPHLCTKVKRWSTKQSLPALGCTLVTAQSNAHTGLITVLATGSSSSKSMRISSTVKRVTFATINVCVLQIETGLRCLMFAIEYILNTYFFELYMARVCVVQSLRFGASCKIRKHFYIAIVTRSTVNCCCLYPQADP